MFNGKKLGAQRYKDESKAVNSEGTDRVKNQFGPWNSIQGRSSETGRPGDAGLDQFERMEVMVGDSTGVLSRPSRIFGCGDGPPRGLPVREV
jgi:hypothetical protein